jgi:hypothetical protein
MPCLEKVSSERFIRKYSGFYSFYDGVSTRSGYPLELPVYGVAMSLAWKKHRMRCTNAGCARRSWVLSDHRIAAKNCLLTTRAAKWATVQVGTGRTVSEVAGELACDWL